MRGLGCLSVESVDISILGYPSWHIAVTPGRQWCPIGPIALYSPFHGWLRVGFLSLLKPIPEFLWDRDQNI